MTFGERLNELRTGQGLSQKALAAKAGVAQTAVGHWETGERDPSWENVTKLCTALGVDCTAFQGCEPGGLKQRRPPGRPPEADANTKTPAKKGGKNK